jgi:hypothetical protein
LYRDVIDIAWNISDYQHLLKKKKQRKSREPCRQ